MNEAKSIVWLNKTKEDSKIIEYVRLAGERHPMLETISKSNMISQKQRIVLQKMKLQAERRLTPNRSHADWDDVYYDIRPGDYGEPNL